MNEPEETMQYVLLIYQGTTPLPTVPEAWATLSANHRTRLPYHVARAVTGPPGVAGGAGGRERGHGGRY